MMKLYSKLQNCLLLLLVLVTVPLSFVYAGDTVQGGERTIMQQKKIKVNGNIKDVNGDR